MYHYYQEVKNKQSNVSYSQTPPLSFKSLSRKEEGAIDLASIMVGIIVIGLVGGVIAATVFAVIPWAQDNAAKQQLDSVVSAQSAYKGLSSGVPPAVPSGYPVNSYGDSAILASANLLQEDSEAYCIVTTGDGAGYQAFAKSASGKYWSVADFDTKPTEIDYYTLPSACDSLRPLFDDPTTRLTQLTYKCDATTAVDLPIKNRTSEGTATWSDGAVVEASSGSDKISKTLTAGETYSVSYQGTYRTFDYRELSGSDCLRSMDHWGSDVGAESATRGFYNAINLVNVPASIPSTIVNASYMFSGAASINDPDISKWNVSNITNMNQMFLGTTLFNQPLNKWNVSNVTNMYALFYNASAFNQPLNGWDVSNVKDMSRIFYRTSFNQPLNEWDVSSATTMEWLFYASDFNQDISNWDVSNVMDMNYMFYDTPFNHPLNDWDVSNVTNMEGMFILSVDFDKPLNKWNVSKVTNMNRMFDRAKSFNQNISNWKTTSLADGAGFAQPSLQDSYMPPRTSR